jgi:hypothetical protein
MANIKVSEMTEATSFDDGDYTMIVQANQNKKIAKENIFSDLENEIATNANGISTINTNIGDLEDLETSDTSSLVNAINSTVPKVLWQNNNTTTNFAAQTITLSEPIENFRYYTLICYQATDNKYSISNTAKSGDGIRMSTIGGGLINYRDITSISGTSCTFNNTTAYSTYAGSSSTANQRLIPFQIIGQY